MKSRSHNEVYFAEKFICFGTVEVYLQLFTQLENCRKISRFACSRAQHMISGMPTAITELYYSLEKYCAIKVIL